MGINEMDPTASAVVEDENGSSMDTSAGLMAPFEELLGNGDGQEMPEAMPARADTGDLVGSRLMDPMGADEPPTFEQPPGSVPLADDVGEGYLRLMMRLEDGQLSIVGARIVDGPLLEVDPTGSLLYQVSVDDRRISAGGLPDLEEIRGFGSEDDEGHGFGVATEADFVVRIPRQDVTEDDLERLEVELLRPAETAAFPAPGQSIQAEAADADRPGPELVARMVGLDFGLVPDDEEAQVRNRLR